jgi:hypothetical protein
MDNYIFSGASVGAWNALFMCYKKDSKKFVHDLLDYKPIKMNDIKEVKYFLKYEVLPSFSKDDFDLRRLFVAVRMKRFQPVTNIFSDFNNLEDAVKCCIASSHIPLITSVLTNKYYNMYTFDGEFSKYPYLNFTENVLHITPSMWKKTNTTGEYNYPDINNKQAFLDSFRSLDIILELFFMVKNRNYMELFDNGYLDAKNNKEVLDKIFLEIEGTTNTTNTNNTNNTNNDNCDYSKYPNSQLDLTRDNDSY